MSSSAITMKSPIAITALKGIKIFPSLFFSNSIFSVYGVGLERIILINSPDLVSKVMSPTSPNLFPDFHSLTTTFCLKGLPHI